MMTIESSVYNSINKSHELFVLYSDIYNNTVHTDRHTSLRELKITISDTFDLMVYNNLWTYTVQDLN